MPYTIHPSPPKPKSLKPLTPNPTPEASKSWDGERLEYIHTLHAGLWGRVWGGLGFRLLMTFCSVRGLKIRMALRALRILFRVSTAVAVRA